ncbi:MAG: dUTP diphosphatase, partial [Clostridia bacterium]|nr:dUTP diphosphatase [Clostridia bacterium]
DYRGEVMVALYNQSAEPQTVLKGERIAQMVFLPCPQATFEPCDSLDETERGSGGFGSTGRK